MSAFVESTLAAALLRMDRAFDCEAAQDRELQGHLLIAYEQLRAMQEMLETERRLADITKRAEVFAHRVRPLRLVRT